MGLMLYLGARATRDPSYLIRREEIKEGGGGSEVRQLGREGWGLGGSVARAVLCRRFVSAAARELVSRYPLSGSNWSCGLYEGSANSALSRPLPPTSLPPPTPQPRPPVTHGHYPRLESSQKMSMPPLIVPPRCCADRQRTFQTPSTGLRHPSFNHCRI